MNTYNNIFACITMTALLPYIHALEGRFGLMLAALIVILVDLLLGVQAATKRGEEIRLSRMCRRTMMKIINYMAFILLGVALNLEFGEIFQTSIISTAIIVVVFALEINSIFNNYLFIKDINYKINVFRWIARKSDIIGDDLDGIERVERKEEKPKQGKRDVKQPKKR